MEDERRVMTDEDKLFCKATGEGMATVIWFKDQCMELTELIDKATRVQPKGRSGRNDRRAAKEHHRKGA
ncbi:MAG: hypothetical protein LUE86_04790 [Clostridiales bacterium]|nr:hypothetical protein [Clostridiales bacterium]